MYILYDNFDLKYAAIPWQNSMLGVVQRILVKREIVILGRTRRNVKEHFLRMSDQLINMYVKYLICHINLIKRRE